MDKIIRIGTDTSKHVFQLHGVNAAEKPVLRKKMRRNKEMIDSFTTCSPTVIAIEACCASHHWARLLTSLGHEVKMIAPQLAKRYVKRNKHDAADAEALCEEMSRPTMRFVPGQDGPRASGPHAGRRLYPPDRRPHQTRQCYPGLRYGIRHFHCQGALPIFLCCLKKLQSAETVPKLAGELFASQAEEYAQSEAKIADVDAKLKAWQRNDERSKRLNTIPGIGPIRPPVCSMDRA